MFSRPDYCTNTVNEYYYEIHITVKTDKLSDFKEHCKMIDVKPVFIDFQLSNEKTVNDVMTSSTVKSNDLAIWDIVNKQVNSLSLKFNVVRVKIETEPTHYLAPKQYPVFKSSSHYFESHIAVHTTSNKLPLIQQLCEQHNAHLSRNPFKMLSDNNNNIVQMCTVRSKDGLSVFKHNVDKLFKDLSHIDYTEPPIIEFALFDSNVSHDKEWITLD